MDRERLKEVHQSDLTEGRINQEFVDWLQTKGMSWLLVVLVGLCAYFAMIRWQHHRVNYQAEAWTALQKEQLPSSLESVADKYPDVGAVAQLARLQAANEYLRAVQAGKMLSSDNDPQAKGDLSEVDRAKYLDRADDLFAKVVQADDKSPQKTLVVVNALNGRAAVAESKGDADKAKQYYNEAAQRATAQFPNLAEKARQRAQSVGDVSQPVTLPSRAELMAIQQKHKPPALDPPEMDTWAAELILPKD